MLVHEREVIHCLLRHRAPGHASPPYNMHTPVLDTYLVHTWPCGVVALALDVAECGAIVGGN